MMEKAWFDFELTYPHHLVQKWVFENRHLSIWLGMTYLASLFIGKKLMENCKPFALRSALSFWNTVMFLLSCVIFVRIAFFIVNRILTHSLYDGVCKSDFSHDFVLFWFDLFVISKPVEFIDTLFIVLRKQQLHFLHYYHHVTVVILCWFSLAVQPNLPNGLYYVAMNSFVHTIMYFYYLLRSRKIIIPKICQMSLTTLQIVQMVIGCFVNVLALNYRLSGKSCDTPYESIALALTIYLSYFLLFADYFYKVYLSSQIYKFTSSQANKDKKDNADGSSLLSSFSVSFIGGKQRSD